MDAVLKVYATGDHTAPPTSLQGQLLWREFYYCVGAENANFHQMVDNPVCLQAEWLLPSRESSDEKAEILLQAWKDGKTGFPWIDAIMTQVIRCLTES